MKIAVLGGDGYCDWATALYLSQQGMRLRSLIIIRAACGITNWAPKR
jgi:nucleoside-diphosphate-sugar epimerase